MSLTWNVEDVEDFESLYVEREVPPSRGGGKETTLDPVYELIILMTMGVGLGGITAKNADEFFARLKFIERLDGPFVRYGDGKPRYIEPGDVRRLVGLTTNVSNESRAKWMGRFSKEMTRDARSYRAAEREQRAAA